MNTYQTEQSDLDVLKDLSKKINALSNESRLKLLVIISIVSKKPKEQRTPTYANALKKSLRRYYGISITEVAVRNHLKILLDNGFVKKEPGASKEDRGVMNYLIVPGAIESLSRDLNILNNTILEIQEEIDSSLRNPLLKVLGGADDGKIFELSKKEIRIGRKGDMDQDDEDYQGDVILSNDYRSVSRVYKPHAFLKEEKDGWYLKDNNSNGGVYVNNESESLHEKTDTDALVLNGNQPTKLKNNDKIKLALGKYSAEMIFLLNDS